MIFKAPLDLNAARILLVNDDGIRAPGLKSLERIARKLSDDVWVVAPEWGRSFTDVEPTAEVAQAIAKALRARR